MANATPGQKSWRKFIFNLNRELEECAKVKRACFVRHKYLFITGKATHTQAGRNILAKNCIFVNRSDELIKYKVSSFLKEHVEDGSKKETYKFQLDKIKPIKNSKKPFIYVFFDCETYLKTPEGSHLKEFYKDQFEQEETAVAYKNKLRTCDVRAYLITYKILDEEEIGFSIEDEDGHKGFFEFLQRLSESYKVVLCAHNLGYDASVLRPHLKELFGKDTLCVKNKKISGGLLSGLSGEIVEFYFLDTFNFFASSLSDAVGESKPGRCPVGFNASGDKEQQCFKGYDRDTKKITYFENWKEYAEFDVLAVEKLFHKQTEIIREAMHLCNGYVPPEKLNQEIEQLRGKSVAGLTEGVITKHCVKMTEDYDYYLSTYKPAVSRQLAESLNASYFGGYVAFNKNMKEINCEGDELIYKFDVISQYTYQLTGGIPIGIPSEKPLQSGQRYTKAIQFKFCLPAKGNGKPAVTLEKVPEFNFFDAPLYSERYLASPGEEFKSIIVPEAYWNLLKYVYGDNFEKYFQYERTLYFEIDSLVSDFFGKIFELKKLCDLKLLESPDDSVLLSRRAILKHMNNSFPGKLGQRDYTVSHYNLMGTDEIQKNFYTSQRSIFAGCYITSMARVQLWEKISILRLHGIEVIGTDTDSITFKTDKHELVKEIFPDEGIELGSGKKVMEAKKGWLFGVSKKYLFVPTEDKYIKSSVAMSGIAHLTKLIINIYKRDKKEYEEFIGHLTSGNILFIGGARQTIESENFKQPIIIDTDRALFAGKGNIVKKIKIFDEGEYKGLS